MTNQYQRHNFRFDEDAEKNLQVIFNWVNQNNDNFEYEMSKTDVVKFCLMMIAKLFVIPYEKNNQNTYANQLQKIEKALRQNNLTEENRLKLILNELTQMKIVLLNLPLNGELQNFTEEGSIPYQRNQKIKELINQEIERIQKQNNN
ncbi:hypothetical protein [Fructobacillus tropaeoli]|uniref:hypothetical protein n=1 Tax=Fructobacillus tropaeoli TaxID=709323 RepID=UPI0019405499|nr:hypothetical protein [Fructobacillus tropaeoli]GIC69417.1 hypothetical protein FT12353_00530 [Fructobacillus tropaeoli]